MVWQQGAQSPWGAQSPVPWERSFWISLSFSARQLAAIRRYIRGNPARALWKRAHPDRFRVMAGIRHGSLDPALRWSAMGDPSVEDCRALAAGRLLLLSSFPAEIPVSPISRANCETMNGRLGALCDEAAEAINTSRDGGVPPPIVQI